MNAKKRKARSKWWVAFANSQQEVDHGLYDGFNCRSQRQAVAEANAKIESGAIIAYAVKHKRTIYTAQTTEMSDYKL